MIDILGFGVLLLICAFTLHPSETYWDINSLKITIMKENNLSIYLSNHMERLTFGTLKEELSAFEQLNTYEETIVVAALIIAALVGSFFKSPLYFYCYYKFKGKGNTPIDILIVINAIIQHTVTIFLTINYSVGLIFDITFSDDVSELWCNMIWYAGVFGGAYRAIGSLGLAILRLKCIRSSHIQSDTFGRNKMTQMMLVILIIGIVVSVVLAIGFGTGNGPASRKQVTWNWCVGSSGVIRETEYHYKLLLGTTDKESDLISLFSVLATMVAIMLELFCYVYFFVHVFIHDRGMVTKKLLDSEQVNKRHHRNAFTFLGQFYCFIAETIIVLSFMYTYKANANINARLAVALGAWIEFGLVSIVEVMTSRKLRGNLPHIGYA